MDHFTLKKLNAEFEGKLNPIVKQIIEFCDFYYERDKNQVEYKDTYYYRLLGIIHNEVVDKLHNRETEGLKDAKVQRYIEHEGDRKNDD